MSISAVLTSLFNFIIQIDMRIVIMIGYAIAGVHFNIGPMLFGTPILVVQVGCLGLGFGIIIASLTTKYRDLTVLVGFGIQLWIYATPVVYTAGLLPEKYMKIYMLNPMSPIMECWRKVAIGSGKFLWGYWGISWIITRAVLFF